MVGLNAPICAASAQETLTAPNPAAVYVPAPYCEAVAVLASPTPYAPAVPVA